MIMDIVKQFMKISGAQTPQELIDRYPTEEDFFTAHPEARKYAKGGSIEAYPQIATFDKAFSYGVPPGPQYLSSGGSAYPMAQTEAQFFIPIYTDVVNPYNKAYGGSNLEVYPNAKVPRVGPTNIWFQQGGENEQMLQQVVQLLQQGVDPQTVVEQLIKSGVPEQDAIQTVQAVVQEIQQAGQQQMPPQQQEPTSPSPVMQDGGQEQNFEIGVGNRLGLFMDKVSSMAANAQNKKLEAVAKGYMKYGGLPKAAPGVNVTAPGKYADPNAYVTANPLDAYTASQFWYDPSYKQAFENYVNSAYKDYYELDPTATVYTNDPIYQQLYNAYSAPGSAQSNAYSATTNANAANKKGVNVLSIDDVSALYTPQGRIKSRSMIDGTRGRGRSNQYMWQTLFNTDNFAEAQRLAAETGLKIDEGTAGIFGRRKKYSYEWDPNRPAGAAISDTTATNQPGVTTPNQAQPRMDFLERIFYKPGNKISGFNRSVNPANIDSLPELSPVMTSQFDPTGYNTQYSPMRNQIMQNRRRRMGDKLDALYQKQADIKESYNQNLSKRDQRRMDRLDTKLTKSGHRSGYSFYEPPTKAYGGIPMAAWGLFNKTAGNENTMVEKETTNFANDYLRGMDKFIQNQNIKSGLTNFLEDPNIQQGLFGATDPMKRLYNTIEAIYPERGIGRGTSFTFNPISGDTQPYKNVPAIYDNFAARSLAPSFSAKQGGSINQGDIRYMTDEEIAEFVANGGQIEYLD